MMKLLPLPFALLLALAGCGKPASEAEPPPGELPAASTPAPATPAAAPAAVADVPALLASHHWRLVEASDAQGGRIDALFVRDERPVQLDFADGALRVSNSCNHMGGRYRLEGERLTLDSMISTQMACSGALGALDGEIGRRLEGTLSLAAAAGAPPRLTLTTAAGDRLGFAGEPTAATRYGGAAERLFLEVAAQTRPCSHPLIPDKRCLQVREVRYDDNGLKLGEPGEWTHFYDEIEGYAHQPGIRNVLRVDRYLRKDAPADASKYAYVLDAVVESETQTH